MPDQHDEAPLPVAPTAWAQPPPPPPPSGGLYQPAPPRVDASLNGFAVASLVLGLLWLFWIGSLLAVIFGHVALSAIQRSGGWERGRGVALAGLLLGYLMLALLAASIVLAALTG